ncbi:MAG: PEGA domain-containing protein [Endomicrobium sp.]|nr:PEGA domain-containing protein [Endomicrobium sp.]
MICNKKEREDEETFIFLLLPLTLAMASRALIFNGTKQNVSVKSMTPYGKIYVDGNYVGADAASVALTRGDNHTVIVKKEDYNTETVDIKSGVQAGWVVFDALLNWFVFFMDPTTGAWCGLDRTNIAVDLEPKK